MSLLSKVNRFFMSKILEDKHVFEYNYFETLSAELEEDTSLFERSFLQYRAQLGRKKVSHILNFFLFFLLPFFILLIIIVWLFSLIKIKNDVLKECSVDIVAVLPYKEIIPNSLLSKNIFFIDKAELSKYGCFFDFKDVVFCFYLLYRYLMYPLLSIKSIIVILQYSVVSKIKCREILVSNEYSYTSSILTCYLNRNNKIVSNCMHGDKVLCLRDCFSCYDNFYVWDNGYIDLLLKMKVRARFYVDSCKFIELDCVSNSGQDIIFFLQGIESVYDLNIIKTNLVKLSEIYNKEYYVKPHPRYPTLHLLDVFDEGRVLTIDYKLALFRSFLVASNYSTVLFQAYINRERLENKFPLIAVNDKVELPEGYMMLNKADVKFSLLD